MAAILLLLFLTGGKPAQEANMAHFTQLGLSTNPDKKPATPPTGKTTPNTPNPQHPSPKRSSDKQKKVALVGSLIATSLL
jgi:hypothetical protein